MKIAVIGVGLIGGSLALDLKAQGFAQSVIGVDAYDANQKLALELGLVQSVETLEKAAQSADLLILTIPVDAICTLAPQALDRISPQAFVTDMGSTKAPIARAIAAHSRRAQFILSHPMAGTENSGPRAALRGLFQGRTAVICDREKCEPTGLEVVERMYRALGMRVVYMSAEEHDLHVAYVSHLSHISSFVLANTVLAKEKNVNTIFDLAGGGFESTVRLAKSSPEMWTPIFAQNLENVREAVQSYIEHLQEFQKSLAEKDFTKTSALMTGANEIRRVLSRMGEKTGESKKNV